MDSSDFPYISLSSFVCSVMRLEDISNAIIAGDEAQASALAKQLLDAGTPPSQIITEGLAPAMAEVGRRFDRLEIFLSEVLLSADAMKAALKVLEPAMLTSKSVAKKQGVVVIGTIEGDVHDIGKNIVATMLEASGFEVHDLGKDVPIAAFIKKAQEYKADFIAVSALMTTTMYNMPRLIRDLTDMGLRDLFKVIVGGAPVLPEWAQEIGADGYGKDFMEAVSVFKGLTEK